jgi:hypothetical protein
MPQPVRRYFLIDASRAFAVMHPTRKPVPSLTYEDWIVSARRQQRATDDQPEILQTLLERAPGAATLSGGAR